MNYHNRYDNFMMILGGSRKKNSDNEDTILTAASRLLWRKKIRNE